MKFKVAIVLTLLVLVSMISFSNRCGKTCDGRAMIAVSSNTNCSKPTQSPDVRSAEQAAGLSPLLRIAVTL